MRFRCERDTLVEALATAGRAVASRGGALPVLSGMRLALTGDRLQLTGTDLDLTIQVSVEVAGRADGVAVVPARLVADIVRALDPGAIEVGVEEDQARITAGRSQFDVRLLPAEDFPRLPEPPEEAVTIEATSLGRALRQVVRAASQDDARPILTGVLLAAEGDGLRLVATDSYRLAIRDLPGASVLHEGQRVLVPSKALGELARLESDGGEVSLRLGEHDVSFEAGSVRLVSRLIEGDFPNYRQLIPESYPNRLILGREPLLDAVRRVRLLARESSTPVRLALSADAVTLSAASQDVGHAHEELDAKYEGEEITVAFNPEYLADGVEVVEGDELILEVLDTGKPAMIRSTEGSDYRYLLMPVRIS